jgi:ABC-type nickel/cobalt efflux system permease component RcnA
VESDVLSKVEVPEEMVADHSWWQRWQTKVSLLFTKTMTDIKDRQSSAPLFIGLLVAFLYGVVHTLGPGHGKAVVIAYFVGERGSLWRGVKIGGQIAVFHVLSAIVVVMITDFAVRQATGSAPSDYRAVRLVSYASIVAIGLWMLIKAVRSARATSHRHDHHAHGDDHEHHHEGCGCAHLAEPAKGIGGFLSLAVGAVPCTGALLVLLFGLANDLLWPSVILVVAISAGMALALSGVGVAAILGRRFLDKRVGEDAARQHKVAAGLRIAAAGAVVVIGCALFALTWSGGVFQASDGASAMAPTPESAE